MPEPDISRFEGAAQLAVDGVAADDTLDAVRAGVRSDGAPAIGRGFLVGIVRCPPMVQSIGDQAGSTRNPWSPGSAGHGCGGRATCVTG